MLPPFQAIGRVKETLSFFQQNAGKWRFFGEGKDYLIDFRVRHYYYPMFQKSLGSGEKE
jgi:hypothetical protein